MRSAPGMVIILDLDPMLASSWIDFLPNNPRLRFLLCIPWAVWKWRNIPMPWRGKGRTIGPTKWREVWNSKKESAFRLESLDGCGEGGRILWTKKKRWIYYNCLITAIWNPDVVDWCIYSCVRNHLPIQLTGGGACCKQIVSHEVVNIEEKQPLWRSIFWTTCTFLSFPINLLVAIW